MKFTYQLVQETNGWVAECIETDAVGEGKTAEAALVSLKRSLEERMFRPDAVAPPSGDERAPIELVPAARADKQDRDLSGPGDVPPSRG